MTYPIAQPADDAPSYTWTPPVRAGIAAANDHQNRITALEAAGTSGIPADGSVTNAKVATTAAITLDKTVDSATRLAMTVTERSILTGLTERIQDDVAGLFAAGTHSGISFAYDDVNNKISATVSGGGAEGANYTGTKTITGKFGVNATPTVKQPINMLTTHAGGSMTGTQDKVAFAFGPTVTGNFSTDTGSNPGFWWGLNLFATTGSSAGDGAGLTDIIGALLEMSIQTPAGTTLPHVIGAQFEAAFFGASSGAVVTQMESCRISAPKRKDGASTGTATNVYGLFIEDVTAYNVGSSNSKFSLFVEGGISRLQGPVTVDNVLQSHNSALMLKGDYSGAGTIQLTTNNIGFFGVTPVARQTLPASGTVTAANIRTALIALGLCV